MKKHSSAPSWFERYTFISPIGQGGMGAVYFAEDNHDNKRSCVVKQIKMEGRPLAEQSEMIKMFRREVEVLQLLNHRGIVKFLDEHESEDGLYVVMEFVPGQTLEAVVAREGPLNSETVVRIGIQCCDVLEYLHTFEPPIIYRDLKPSNLILRPDGLVVFIDFGIARDFDQKNPSTRVVTSGYSPPEQYYGKPEPRGDLYSLGSTMHHLLTGVRPRPLTTSNPAQINPRVAPRLDALIQRLTAHDSNDRPLSARVVQQELFSIYRDFHPEFVIPETGMDVELESRQAVLREEARMSANLRTMNIQQSAARANAPGEGRSNGQAEISASASSSESASARQARLRQTGDRKRSNAGNGFLARVKNWLGALVGR